MFGQKNKRFLNSLNSKLKNLILEKISVHYGITSNEAFEEIIDSESEHILDYLTGETRTATSLLIKRIGY